ncbi:TraR/DksA family transcriptional regulator [Pseudomonadota bacterium]
MEAQYSDIKDKLITLRKELSQRKSNIDHDRYHIEQPLDRDSAERAVEMENDDVLDALDSATINELKAINKALKRIDNGDYDTCSLCGVPIPPQRLNAIPYTEHCVACATRLE